jgi:hypothetical protein
MLGESTVGCIATDVDESPLFSDIKSASQRQVHDEGS